MNDLEHQYLFDKVVSAAAEMVYVEANITLDEAKKRASDALTALWSYDLSRNLNKRGVIAELTKSIADQIK